MDANVSWFIMDFIYAAGSFSAAIFSLGLYVIVSEFSVFVIMVVARADVFDELCRGKKA